MLGRSYNRYKPHNKRRKILLIPLVMLIIIVSLIFYIDSRIRPIIKSVSSYQAKLVVVKYINNSILNTIQDEHLNSSDIVKITVGENGVVSSIQSDMVTINKLKADITEGIAENLSTMQIQKVSIPIGSLLGIQLLAGRGPKVSFDIIPSSFVQSKFVNNFKAAGINQTLHQLSIEITTSVMAIVPGYTTTTEVIADFCIAETVIVGVVPEAFTQVITGEDFDPGIINDFGANLTK